MSKFKVTAEGWGIKKGLEGTVYHYYGAIHKDKQYGVKFNQRIPGGHFVDSNEGDGFGLGFNLGAEHLEKIVERKTLWD